MSKTISIKDFIGHTIESELASKNVKAGSGVTWRARLNLVSEPAMKKHEYVVLVGGDTTYWGTDLLAAIDVYNNLEESMK